MPELPEVETTTRGLKETIVGLTIKAVWTDLMTTDKRKIDAIATPRYFKVFKKEIVGAKITSVGRRGKNILLHLNNKQTILIHMKLTGHLLYGKFTYITNKNTWIPAEKGPLEDPFNRFLHVVFTFTNGKQLAFSDARKFGKITLIDTETRNNTKHLKDIGPEPLEKKFQLSDFKERLLRKPNGKIMTVLMDQSIIAGIGNIYSDEILWRVGVHSERRVKDITEAQMKGMFKAMKETLAKGIDFGGDSTSDYRDIYGRRGKFQATHRAYKQTGKPCQKKGCRGIIVRKMINGRSGHYCSIHQAF